MKVFVDECVNRRVLRYINEHSAHIFVHILYTPLRSTKNGALLRAVAPDYDVFLTTDRHLKNQQNLANFPMAFVVMRAKSNDIEDVLPLVPETLFVLEQIASGAISPGDLYEIMPPE